MVTQRQNTGGLVGGAILIGLGTLFLLGQFVHFSAWQYLWPLAMVGMGAIFFIGMVAGGKQAAGLAIPGSILSTLGLLMLFQNLTGHWETWSYGWTIIILAVGIGIFIMGAWTGNSTQRQSGLRVAGIGFVLFAVFGSFFELLLFRTDGSAWGQLVLPVALILAGLWLVIRRAGFWPRRTSDLPPDPMPQPPAPPQL
jgi:hypothetical protein